MLALQFDTCEAMNILKKLTNLFDQADSRQGMEGCEQKVQPQPFVVTIKRDRKMSRCETIKSEETSDEKEDIQFDQFLDYSDELEELVSLYLPEHRYLSRMGTNRKLSYSEWEAALNFNSILSIPRRNVYYSILHGIEFPVRKHLWESLSKSYHFRATEKRSYQQLTDASTLSRANLSQIEHDVPRSRAVSNSQQELKNILVAYCNYSGQDYTQGMNMIAGALLTQLALQNDEKLREFEIVEPEYEERVLWVFVGVMLHKGWQGLLDEKLIGLKEVLGTLGELMQKYVPKVYNRIIELDWNISIFAQHYITIMQIYTPVQLGSIVLDLFMLEGEQSLHSVLLRMMKLNQSTILECDQFELMDYLKRGMIRDTYNQLKRDQRNALSLESFSLNYMRTHQEHEE